MINISVPLCYKQNTRLQEPSSNNKAPVSTTHLVHFPDHIIDLIFPISSISSLNVVDTLLGKTTKGRGQLERPQETVGCLEVRANSVNLVDKVLDTDDPM